MARPLSDAEVRRLRMRSQRLAGERAGGVHELVRAMGGVQAQHTPAARLSLRPRTAGVDAAAVTRACNQQRSVVRTWLMRGTLHMVTAEDAGWLLALYGPRLVAGDRRRRLQLGLDDDLCARALPAIAEVLGARGPLPRAELVRELAAKGVAIDPSGQAPAHLVAYAAAHGLLCRGPDLPGDEPTYVLLEDWIGAAVAPGPGAAPEPEAEPGEPGPPGPEAGPGPPGSLGPEAALAEVARRYLAGHGPAGAADLAAWSGLPIGQARQGIAAIAAELEAVEVAGEEAWLLAAAAPDAPGGSGGSVAPGGDGPGRTCDPDGPQVRLLGAFDPYLLGYRGRDLALAPAFAARINAGGGWVHPALLVDGWVAGTWRQRRAGARLAITVEPFERLDPAARRGLEAEVADLGRFLGTEATLAVEATG